MQSMILEYSIKDGSVDYNLVAVSKGTTEEHILGLAIKDFLQLYFDELNYLTNDGETENEN